MASPGNAGRARSLPPVNERIPNRFGNSDQELHHGRGGDMGNRIVAGTGSSDVLRDPALTLHNASRPRSRAD